MFYLLVNYQYKYTHNAKGRGRLEDDCNHLPVVAIVYFGLNDITSKERTMSVAPFYSCMKQNS